MQRAQHYFYTRQKPVIDVPTTPYQPALWPSALAAAWFAPEQFSYAKHDETAALLRLVGRLRAGLDAPAGAALLVERGGSHSRYPSKSTAVGSQRLNQGLSRSHPMLWQATFELPLEIVEHPGAMFVLTADSGLAIALGAPRLSDGVRANDELAAWRPWLPAHVRRHAVAMAASFAAAVALTPTAAAMADTSSTSSPAPATAPATSSSAGSSTTCPPSTASSGTATATQSSSSPAAGQDASAACDSGGQTGSSGSTTPTTPTTPAKPSTPAKHSGSGKPKPKPQPPAHHDKPAAHPDKPAAHKSKPAAHHSKSTKHHSKSTKHHSKAAHPGAKHTGHTNATSSHANVAGHHSVGSRTGAAKSTVRTAASQPLTTTAGVSGYDYDNDGDHDADDVPAAVVSPWTDPAVIDPYTAAQIAHYESIGASLDQPPSFLIPIYKAAGRKYHIPWQILAAINAIETDYGRNLNTSSAGAKGWMQFEPATWQEYGVSADGSRAPNPYNPRDAIFSAARYLAASGGSKHLRKAIFAYNHALWYVDAVLWRAQLIGAHAFKASKNKHGYALPLDAQYMRQLGRTDDGVDIEDAPDGAAVYSIATGVVTAVASDPSGFGPSYPVILITKGPLAGQSIYYGHVAASLVKIGQHVIAGQPIAVMGHTGDAAGLGHGHIEIGFSDVSGDPIDHGAPTPSGDAMREVLVALSGAYHVKNS